MNRYRAFLAHLGISATIVGIFLLLTFFVWYPSPLFTIEGTQFPILILVGVDVVLGPLLTLIVFKSGKPRLKMDLAIIALIQVSAFIYGANIIFKERPAFIAFAVDRFVVVQSADKGKMEMDKLDPEKIKLSMFGPTWVYAESPTNNELRNKILFEVLEGKFDIDRRPEFYRDFKSHIHNNFDRAFDLEAYGTKYDDLKPAIEMCLEKTGKTYSDIAAYPIIGKHKDMFIVLDKPSRSVIGTIDIHPWLPMDKTRQENHNIDSAAEK